MVDQLYVTHHVQYHVQYGQTGKWTQPGWRMAQRYANKVLIGNWVEEKLQFTRECKTATTAPTVQTTSHRGPDVIVRQMAPWKAEGLAAKLLLSHHGTLPSHYLVTLYDEMYRRQGSSTLLTLCSWHPDRLARMPEKSDHHRYPILSATGLSGPAAAPLLNAKCVQDSVPEAPTKCILPAPLSQCAT
uniref:uncharacterized protein C1orf158-like n=1 Tax=Oncorhynchus gorbuscha TaxID=8017 RepID=UPI001EAEA839|nr:uncharacterized protein C1orf158-like [Oncorhynchus gorbuscha]